MKTHRWIAGFLTVFTLALASVAQGVDQITYYHNDALGSPVAATDASGTVIWRESYLPHGKRRTYAARETLCQAGTCTPVETQGDEKLWYTGKFEETRVGLLYLGARWYDPDLGRFLSVDPARYTPASYESFNRYAYANNNPYRYVDPDGRFPLDYFVDWASIGISAGLFAADPSLANGLGLAADVVLGILPYVPAGVGALRAGDKTLDAVKVEKSAVPLIKAGSAGGETAGRRFPEAVRDAAKAENPTATCVYCRMEGTATQVDHAMPKARGGNATLDNAQLACPHCNASKGAGDFPKTPPAGYRGPWPPEH